jgi:hypothetical protein
MQHQNTRVGCIDLEDRAVPGFLRGTTRSTTSQFISSILGGLEVQAERKRNEHETMV